jgi:predicted nucleic acid-binding protein
VWLSVVVACELYAGTRSPQERQALDRLVRDAAAARQFLAPSPQDWIQAGTLLARRVRLHGTLRPRDHLADVLIVVSTARIGGEIVTANLRHFEAWAELARRAGLGVTVTDSW